jgi:uncharacterized lipoprotein YddW (UPF0748 family)
LSATKRFAALLFATILLLSACGKQTVPPQTTQPAVSLDEIRAVWLSYYELTLPQGCSPKTFRDRYEIVFARMEAFGLNTVFVQVRPFGDAIYPSDFFPWSEILTGTQGGDPGFDPLAILAELAKEHHLHLHAWINPFRIAKHADAQKLAESNPALEHIKTDDDWVKIADGRYHWNPALPAVHALIYDGVREILTKYDIAGLHIDDYFYPTADEVIDQKEYQAYANNGGALPLADWRRELMNAFVAGLRDVVKRTNPDAVFSVSPSSNIEKARTQMFADVGLWMREEGFADWIIPQVYFGFAHDTMDFAAIANQWAGLPKNENVKLVFGLAAYKTGRRDDYAGSAADEWLTHSDILARQLEMIRTLNGYSGFALYSYQGILGEELSNIAKKEGEIFKRLLTNVSLR